MEDSLQSENKDDSLLFSLEYLSAQLSQDLSSSDRSKAEQLINTLKSSDIVDLERLRVLASQGIPDKIRGLRALIWKLILGCISPKKSLWKKALFERRSTYNQFLEDFLKKPKIPPQQLIEERQNDMILAESSSSTLEFKGVTDHPLSQNSGSGWRGFFEDAELYAEIEKDTERTRSEEVLFKKPTEREVKIPIPFPTTIKAERKKARIVLPERHCDVLARILFIYAKLNAALRYVQGMNEILAPIYYACFEEQVCPLFQERSNFDTQIEADSFFCFLRIMGILKDRFIREVDGFSQGIKYKCEEFQRYLKVYDNDLWFHFTKLNINPQFYSLRWLLLLFAQEFSLSSTLRLWDTLLSKKDPLLHANFIGLAILQLRKQFLLSSDFAIVMTNLQRIENIEVDQIVILASEIELLEIDPGLQQHNDPIIS